jgi:hypothetical protein
MKFQLHFYFALKYGTSIKKFTCNEIYVILLRTSFDNEENCFLALWCVTDRSAVSTVSGRAIAQRLNANLKSADLILHWRIYFHSCYVRENTHCGCCYLHMWAIYLHYCGSSF